MALIQYKISSKELRTKTDITVILPQPAPFELEANAGEEFFKPGKKYQVLYLYHGTYGDNMDWLRFSRIESYAQKYRVAVVMPNVQNSCFNNMPNMQNYYNFVAKELPQIINWTFPISDKREDNFVAGLSMGAAGAFKIGMDNPDKFGAVASLSIGFNLHKHIEADRNRLHAKAFAPDEALTGTANDPYWLAKKLVDDDIDYPRFYLCCGNEDPVGKGYPEFMKYLDEIGFRYDHHEQPGGHDWDFWDDEIKRVLEWLPLKRDLVD